MSPTSKAEDDANAMPPPPVPVPNKLGDAKFLQPEFEALAQCLKDAIVKTSQVYSFYSEAQKLGIMHHIPNPPRKLTTALGRDIERYDQLCDSLEAQLHRAISVLKRDLRREEQKKEEERRRNATKVANIEPMVEDTLQPPDAETMLPKTTTTLLARRPSTVSISSLQRPRLPLKLDLSSASLRITEEEAAMFHKDLGSPVTLAPKSARPVGPNEFPPDLMMAFSNTPIQSDLVHGPPIIDLTMSDNTEEPSGLPLQLGNTTSNKAIDLDLDIDIANMADLFGDPANSQNVTNPVTGLFTPLNQGDGRRIGDQPLKENVLSSFQMDANVDVELFGEFNPDAGHNQGGPANTSTGAQSGASPGSLLAQFSASGLEDSKVSFSAPPTLSSVPGEGFDLTSIDLSNLESRFFAAGQNSEMDFHVDMDFMGMDAGGATKTE